VTQLSTTVRRISIWSLKEPQTVIAFEMSDGGLEIGRPSGNDAIVCIDAAIAKNAVDDKMYASIRKRFIFSANVPDDLSLLASGVTPAREAVAGAMTEVPKA
jgi:hypothetical protein